MYPSSIIHWCCVLLLVAASSKSRGNSTNSSEQKDNSTVQYDRLVNSMKDDNKMMLTLYNLRENSTKNDRMQYEPHNNSMNNDRKNSMRYEHIMKLHKENDQMSMESRANFTKVNGNDSMLQEFNESLIKTKGKSNSTSYELYRNSSTDDYNNSMVTIVSYEACGNETCIQFCCPFGDHLTSERKCVAGQNNYSFPNIYRNDSENKKLDELFQLTIRNPCILEGSAHRILNPTEYSLLVNGSLYLDSGDIIPSTSYCLAALDRNIYDVIVCLNQIGFPTYISVCLLVSLPFLLLTFVVYSILPHLQNVHGYTLRVHVASLFITNVVIFCVQEIPELSEWKYCIPLVYIFNFSMLSGCFWLNATCFDIWWTFRKLELKQINVKHQKKKKFLMYSIYAWGITFALTIACAIMDHVPGIPKDLIRPEMCKKKFWFGGDDALTVYFYVPTGIAYISNIFFFITTMLTILYHNKYTAHQLRDSESRRYNQNKRKFTMYLKLFIVMGVTWVLGIILWLINASDSIPQIVWNVSYTIDILQGLIIFVIYVCKKKILRQLLKRFGWHEHDPFWISSNRCTTRTSSNMSSLTSVSSAISMQNISPFQQINHLPESNK